MSKISELSNGGALLSTDDLIVVRSGGNVRAQLSSLNGIAIGSSTPAAGSFTTGSFSGNVSFADNAKAIFGAGSDLQIYHDSAQSIIADSGTGHFFLRGENIYIQNADGSANYLAGVGNEASLYYIGDKKLATTSTGIDVTGSVTADGLTLASGSQATIGVFGTSGLQLIGNSGGDSIVGTLGGSESLILRTASTERMRIDGSTGNVGIGTTPSEVLHVVDSNPTLTVSSSSVDQAVRLELYEQKNGSADLGGFFEYSGASANALLIGTTLNSTDTTHLYLPRDGSGNVLIGKSSTSLATAGLTFGGAGFASLTRDGAEPLSLNRLSDDGKLAVLYAAGTEIGSLFTNGGAFVVKGNSASAPVQLQTHDGSEDIEVDPDGFIKFETAGSEAMRIDSSQNLLVGTTNSSGTAGSGIKLSNPTSPADDGKLMIVGATSTSGQDAFQIYSTGASAYRFFVNYAGSVYATSTSITAISDESLKENIRDLDKGLDTVLGLKPRRFDWKNGDGDNIMGFVAQEVDAVLPELVHDFQYTETETKLGLKMGDMIPTLVKAIQEQQTLIETLTDRIAALENN